jgi:hypothetical protein
MKVLSELFCFLENEIIELFAEHQVKIPSRCLGERCLFQSGVGSEQNRAGKGLVGCDRLTEPLKGWGGVEGPETDGEGERDSWEVWARVSRMEADIEECGYVPGVKFKSCRYDT